MNYVNLNYSSKEIDFIAKHVAAMRYCDFHSKSPKELAALSATHTKLLDKLKSQSTKITKTNLVTMLNALQNISAFINAGIIPLNDLFPEQDISEPEYTVQLRNAFLFLHPYCCELGFYFEVQL